MSQLSQPIDRKEKKWVRVRFFLYRNLPPVIVTVFSACLDCFAVQSRSGRDEWSLERDTDGAPKTWRVNVFTQGALKSTKYNVTIQNSLGSHTITQNVLRLVHNPKSKLP